MLTRPSAAFAPACNQTRRVSTSLRCSVAPLAARQTSLSRATLRSRGPEERARSASDRTVAEEIESR